jgi:hypothetical protein
MAILRGKLYDPIMQPRAILRLVYAIPAISTPMMPAARAHAERPFVAD